MKYRVLVLPIVGAIVVLGGFFVSGNLDNNLVYYLTPTEAISKRSDFPDGKRFRLGGFVQPNTVVRKDDGLTFAMSSDASSSGKTVNVSYTGAPAQLFRGGIGVVVEGAWRGDWFQADTMMIKHDSGYRPPTPSPVPTGGPASQRSGS